jgi:hypothetical protein
VNEVTYKRLQRALEDVERASHPLEEILFNGRRPAFSTPPTTIQTFNPKMNEPQIEAIKFALSANGIAQLHEFFLQKRTLQKKKKTHNKKPLQISL